MAKIVIIGAGSHVFASRFITDIISYPELRDGTITLMDIAAEPLALTTAFAKRIVEQNKFNTKIESTTDRRKALEGADYVLITIKVGGGHHLDIERDISLKYGLDQGDMACIGSGGAFDSIRHIPPILDICHDMEELCPNALLLNYTNPMATISWSVNDYTKIKNVGLCHSVFGTAKTLAKYIDKPFEEVSYWVAGLNHFAWFLEFKWRGEDAYPLLREKFKDPAVYSGPTHTTADGISSARNFSRLSVIMSRNPVIIVHLTPPISAKKPKQLSSINWIWGPNIKVMSKSGWHRIKKKMPN